jgi:hypothetical protein
VLVLDAVSSLAVFGLAVAVVLLFFAYRAQYNFAATTCSEARLNRLGIAGPVLVWFGLYLLLQVLLVVGIVAEPLAWGVCPEGGLAMVSINFLDVIVTDQDAVAMPLGFLPVLLLATAVLIWRTVASWNTKISLA